MSALAFGTKLPYSSLLTTCLINRIFSTYAPLLSINSNTGRGGPSIPLTQPSSFGREIKPEFTFGQIVL
jgi:hypothetical protein